jgi:hypothetical protein
MTTPSLQASPWSASKLTVSMLVLFSVVIETAGFSALSSSSSLSSPLRVRTVSCNDVTNPTLLFMADQENRNEEVARDQGSGLGRRSVLGAALFGIIGLTFNEDSAMARDELFKPNPLTNPLLEQVSVN